MTEPAVLDALEQLFATAPLWEDGPEPDLPDDGDAPDQQPWDPPASFAAYVLPVFPVGLFTPWLRDWSKEIAESTQTPVDLPAIMALSAVSGAVAKVVVVEALPGWREPVNIYTAPALGSGNRKSAVVNAASAPLAAYEMECRRVAESTIAEQQSRLKIAEQALQTAQRDAAKATGDQRLTLTADADRLALEVADLRVPAIPHKLADDCTPERLASLLAENDGKMTFLSPEGGIFEMMSGRYSASGVGNFDIFLKAHAGDDMRVDRVGRPSEWIPRPAITLGLAVQPEVLRGLAEKPGFRGKGLLGRFLYALPKSLLGRRKTLPAPADPDALATYRAYLSRLLRFRPATTADGQSEPHVLYLEHEAATQLVALMEELEPRLGEEGDLASLTDWAGKLAGAVARLAGLLHMATHVASDEPWSAPISPFTMQAAIAMGRYFLEHARAAFAEMGTDPAVEDAKFLLRWVGKSDLREFSKRDAFEATKTRFRKADALDAPLELLEKHGYIRQQPGPEARGRGRPPSPNYDVNPLWSAPASEPEPKRPSQKDLETELAARRASAPRNGHVAYASTAPVNERPTAWPHPLTRTRCRECLRPLLQVELDSGICAKCAARNIDDEVPF